MKNVARNRNAHKLFDAITDGCPSSRASLNLENRVSLRRKRPCLVDPFQYFNENDVPKAWSSRMSSLVRGNRPREAIRVFKAMLVDGKRPNFVTILSLIKAVGLVGSRILVDGVHSYAIKMGFVESEVSVGTALTGVYSGFDMSDAWKLFYQTTNKDVVLWSAMVSACVSNGMYGEAFKLLKELMSFGLHPNHVTIASILPACSDLGALKIGKEIHNYCLKREFYSYTVLQNSLVGMYANCGYLEVAFQVFNEIEHKDIVSWRIMISCCVEGNFPLQAFQLFSKLLSCGTEKIDEFIIQYVIGAYSQLDEDCIRLGFHSLILKRGFTSYVSVVTELLQVCAKFGNIELARNLFDLLERKDIIAWSVMIMVYARSNQPNGAFDVLRQLHLADEKPNEFTFVSLLHACISISAIETGEGIHAQITKHGYSVNAFLTSALIDMYCRFGETRQGRSVFDGNPAKDFICWSSMINGYGINGCGEEVLACFSNMLHYGIEPNDIVFISVLSACSHCGLEYEGWQWFYAMEEVYGIIPNLAHYACMVDMLSRQGNIEEALEFVKKMPIEADKRIWGALLAGAQNTSAPAEILELVTKKLISLDPENTSYSVVLSNLYAEQGRWEEVEKLRSMTSTQSLKKVMAYSAILS